MKVFRAWDTFQGQANAKTWIFSIARNHLYDKLRKQKREQQLLREAASEVRTNDFATHHGDLEMVELLMGLKLPYRQVIVLRYMQDMTTEEVADSPRLESRKSSYHPPSSRTRIAQALSGRIPHVHCQRENR